MRLARSLAGLFLVLPWFTYACGGAADDTDGDAADGDSTVGGGGGGAGGDSGNGSESIACRSDKVCTPHDLLCDTSRSVCVECLSADDCGDDALCTQGACVAVTPCDSSKDCSTNEVCDTTLGYCVECVGDNDCADNQVCAATTCHDTCDSSKDCAAADQVCGGDGFCVDCDTNADCGDGSYCSANVCVSAICEAGGTSCDGDDLLTCNAEGSGFDVSTCADGCGVTDGVAACDGEEPTAGCAGGTANPCSSIPKFIGTQTVDGDPEDFCDIPYKTLSLANAGFVGGTDGSPIDASTITTNSQARFKVAWSATGLHAHVHVVDPVLRVEEPSMEYQGDNVQFFIQGAEPAGGSPLLSGSTAYIKAADVPSEPQQIFLVPKAGSYAGSSRLSVPWSTTGFESATRQVSDGYEIEIFYPWPDAVAPMTASKVIGLDFMVGVNDDASPSSTREFEYGLYLGNVSNSSCGSYSSYNAPWCDNGLWCTPTTAD